MWVISRLDSVNCESEILSSGLKSDSVFVFCENWRVLKVVLLGFLCVIESDKLVVDWQSCRGQINWIILWIVTIVVEVDLEKFVKWSVCVGKVKRFVRKIKWIFWFFVILLIVLKSIESSNREIDRLVW